VPSEKLKARPKPGLQTWWRGEDLNLRPSGYESRIDAEPTFEVPVGIVTVATNRDTADDHQSVQADLLLPSPTDNRQHQVRLTLLIMEDFR
jgi:hypothetical protein